MPHREFLAVNCGEGANLFQEKQTEVHIQREGSNPSSNIKNSFGTQFKRKPK